MSATDGGPGRREIAHRLFAAEFNESTLEYSDSDEERAPKYVITPTGARVNRLFVVGVLTEVEWVNDDVIRARIADPTGAFVVYAGQYQPDALSFLEGAEAPAFVAVTGKANTFRPDGSDRVFTSIRPESITDVDVETRDRWTVQAAEHTLERVDRIAAALSVDGPVDRESLRAAGFEPGVAAGIALAVDHYGTTTGYLDAVRRMALDALRLVAERVDAVETPSIPPDGSAGAVEPSSLRLPESGPLQTVSIASADEGIDDGTTERSEPPTDAAASVPESTAPEEPEPATGSDEPEVEMYELDDAERAEVEAEYGTEFSTGAEMDSPADDEATEPPEPASVESDSTTAVAEGGAGRTDDDQSGPVDPESGSDTPADRSDPTEDDGESAPDSDPGTTVDGDENEVTESDGPSDEAVDLEESVVDAMTRLAGDDGAERDAIVEAVVDAHDVDPDAVEDAIEDALMSGRCYEPRDGVFKPI